MRIGRRRALALGSGLLVTGAHTAFGADRPSATNPLPASVRILTIVVPEYAAGLRFYAELLGFPVLREGRCPAALDPYRELAARRYALLGDAAAEHGLLRLLEAPAGAAANRPHPAASLTNPGLAGLELMTRNDEEAFLRLKDAGVQTITPPLFYYQTGVEPLPGATSGWDFQDLEITTFVAYGPGGENVFISQGRTLGHKPWPAWTQPGLIGMGLSSVLISLDRWALFDFYGRAFGLKPSKDQLMAQDACNALIGAPTGTYFHFGGLGDGVGFEWWEFRDRKPAATPPYPTALNATGLAMATIAVPDLAAFTRRLAGVGIAPLARGALPTLSNETPDGVLLRGPVGELIEVIAAA
jgi:catechol 2,3-dioxygenase-like lactoylglutathione lyase family enzyme